MTDNVDAGVRRWTAWAGTAAFCVRLGIVRAADLSAALAMAAVAWPAERNVFVEENWS